MAVQQNGVAWITGASSGIGRALAQELSARGMAVVLTARRESELQAVKERCAHPERTFVLPGDLLDGSCWDDLARAAGDFAGPVTLLVNNAGVSQRARAEDTRIEDVRRLMELNFFAPIGLTQAVLPSMRAHGRGRIVIISSVMGYLATPLRSSYAASKHAVRGYFDCLRAELDGSGIGVTVVCPGYVRTEISEHAVAAGGGEHGATEKSIANGMDPAACARSIADAVEKGESELLVGGPETYAVYLRRLLPGLFERFAPRFAPT